MEDSAYIWIMKKALGFAGMLIVGGFIGYLGASFFLADEGGSGQFPDHYSWVILLLLPVLYFIVVGWHELGHVFAGKMENFTFHSFTVGPFAWKREDDGRIGFRWNRNLNVSGGVAVMLPEGPDNLANRFARYAAGGPVASLILALVCLGLYQVLPTASFARITVMVIAMLSGLIFVATVIPFRAGGFASDGKRVITLLQGGPEAKADIAVLRAMGVLRAGEPYDQLPLAEFKAMEQIDNVSPIQLVTGQYYQYLYHLDQQDLDQAEAMLNTVMDNLSAFPKGMEGGFYLEKAFFLAKFREDLPGAEAAFARFEPNPMTEALSIALAKAAIADLKEDRSTVLGELPVIEKGLARTMDQSRVPMIKEWLKHWKDGVKTDL